MGLGKRLSLTGKRNSSNSSSAQGSTGVGVGVVKVRNALITHHYVASKNVAVSEDNASHDRAESVHVDGRKSMLKRMSTNRGTEEGDPISPYLKDVLQALMHFLRPSDHCRLLTSLHTANSNNQQPGGRESIHKSFLKTFRSMPNLHKMNENEYFLALISNRLSGSEEDALFFLHATKVDEKKRLQRRTKSLQKMNSSATATTSTADTKAQTEVLKETGSFVADKFAKTPESKVDLKIVKILPIWLDLRVALKGRGLVSLSSAGESIRIGTVSVRSMWGLVAALTKAKGIAKANNFYPQGPSHKWIEIYFNTPEGSGLLDGSSASSLAEIDIPDSGKNANNTSMVEVEGEEEESDGESTTSCSVNTYIEEESSSSKEKSFQQQQQQRQQNEKQKQRRRKSSLLEHQDARSSIQKMMVEEIRSIIVSTHNLDDLTTGDVIRELEKRLGKNVVGKVKKSFIDEKIIQIFGQQQPPSLIADGIYLGTEYNASNYTELRELGVSEIVNVTKEIKSFFPGLFDYYRISVKDVESADLGSHLEPVVKQMVEAREQNKVILVHCQRGVSRSATVVIAYIMYVHGKSYKEAHEFVKKHRSCIKPNKGFQKQLQQYEQTLKTMKK